MTTSNDSPDILYHYTSLDAFRKIVETKTIRATHYQQLNDQSELEIARREIRDLINKKYRCNKCKKEHGCKKRYGCKKQLVLEELEQDDWRMYIFSLSASKNLLSQWRAYTHPLDGGVDIGFSRNYFKLHIEGFEPIEPYKCCYEPSYDLVEIENIINTGGYMGQLYNALQGVQFFLQSTMKQMCVRKHIAYEDEAEWRCVHFTPRWGTSVKLDERHRKFVEFQFDPQSIEEIWISPHGNRSRIENVVTFLKEHSPIRSSCEIHQSEIPYRTSHY